MLDPNLNSPLSLESLLERLGNTVKAITADTDIDSDNLQNLLIFISEVVEAVQRCFEKILIILTKLKFITFQDYCSSGIILEIQREIEENMYDEGYREAMNLCHRFRIVRSSYETQFFPKVTAQKFNDLEEWFNSLISVEQARSRNIKKLKKAYLEIKNMLVYISDPKLDEQKDEDRIRSYIREINYKAAHHAKVLDESLRKLQELNNLILGRSGKIGFLELIKVKNRSSLAEQASIYLTHIMSEKSENSTYNLNYAKFGGGFAGTGGTQSGGTFYDYSSNQNLAETAAQIQQLLEQLDKTYATETTTGKMTIATEAIKRIENDPTFKERVLSALKAGGTQALAQLLNHPAASFVIGALDDWEKTKD